MKQPALYALSYPAGTFATERGAPGESVTRVAAAAMAVCATATLPTLGRQPLSWDEAVTLSAGRRNVAELAGLLGHTDAPLGLYYLMIHEWIRGLGFSGVGVTAFWLRLPSAAAAIGAVGLVTVLAARWFGRRSAVAAGLLFAVHPMLTFYAQDARPYTLVVFAFLVSTLLLFRAQADPSPIRLALYTLAATITVYLHLFVIYAFAAHVVHIVRTGNRKPAGQSPATAGPTGRPRDLTRWAVVAGITVATCLPLFVVAAGERSEVGWIPSASPATLFSVISRLLGGVVLAVIIMALIVIAWRDPEIRRTDGAVSLVVWAMVPVVALVVADLVVPDLVARYALVTVPAVVVLAAAAATAQGRLVPSRLVPSRLVPSRLVQGLLIAAVVVAAVTTVVQQVRAYKYEDFRSATDVMGDLARPGDAVMFLPRSTRAGFEAYRTMEPDVTRVRDPALAPGPFTAGIDQLGGTDRPAGELAALFDRAPAIFVLGDDLDQARRNLRGATDRVQEQVLSGYRVRRTIQYGGIYLTELLRADTQVRAARGPRDWVRRPVGVAQTPRRARPPPPTAPGRPARSRGLGWWVRG